MTRALQAALLAAPAAAALLALATSLCAGATTVPSIVLEDGSTLLIVNDTLVLDGSLGGAHAGQVFVANGSSLTLSNVSLTVVNATSGGGIRLDSSARLFVNNSNLTGDSASEFSIEIRGGAALAVESSQVLGLQLPSDLSAPAILLDGGATLRAANSTLKVRPDLRPLADASQATLEFTACTMTGSVKLTQGSLSMKWVVQTAIGSVTAVEVAGGTALITNSTINATGGASALAASQAASVTVASTNLSAEDIGASGAAGAHLVLQGVVIEAGSDLSGSVGAFGLVADASAVDAQDIAVFGFPTALWLRGSTATLRAAQLSSGVVRLNASQADIDGSPMLEGAVVVEPSSVLTLTDTAVDWTRVDVAGGSVVIPRFRSTFDFYSAGGAPAAGILWSVFPVAGPAAGSGVSDANGSSTGPPLEGPHFAGRRFDQAPAYRIEMNDGNTTFVENITAWGPSLVFPFYLNTAAGDLAFDGPLLFSSASPSVGSNFTASASLGLRGPLSSADPVARLLVDGVDTWERTVHVSAGASTNVSFTVASQSGVHLVVIQVDMQGPLRGAVPESSEVADNMVGLWYNASAGNVTSVKPDLVITEITYELSNTTARDPVTGEVREARDLIVWLNISNAGLTAAGSFDVVVAAGLNTSRVSVPLILAHSWTRVNLTFGPYIEPQDLVVRAQLDVSDRVSEGNENNNTATITARIDLPAYHPPERPVWVTALVLASAGALVALSLWGVFLVFRKESDEEEQPGEGPPRAEARAVASGTALAAPASSASAAQSGDTQIFPDAEAAPQPAAPAATPPAQPPAGAPPVAQAQGPPTAAPPQVGVPPPPMVPPPAASAPPPRFGPGPQSPPSGPYPWPYYGYYGAPPPYAQYPGVQPPPGPTPGPRYQPVPAAQPASHAVPPMQPPPPAPPQPAAPPARCPRCGSPQVSYLLLPRRQVVCSSCGTSTPF